MKLLIADDNAAMRLLLRRLCASLATETRDCENGDEAVRISAEFKPDWTLMDIAMPGVDGLAATRQIIAQRPDARIIVVTNYNGPEYKEAAREAGACAFVHKENLQSLLPLLSQTPQKVNP